jgi:16S rRNA (guanine966-N2)-methyltransferase
MRVIAGRLGGRRLSAPKGMATRPTSDRVREALFSVLGDLTDLAILDLYAGTGALGLEALSRGARRSVFVESSRQALVVLRKNIEDLGVAPEALVLGQPVARAIERVAQEGPYDVVLVDPPYALLGEVVTTLRALAARGADPSSTSERDPSGRAVFSPGARLVLEHASRDAPPEEIAGEARGQRAGQALTRTSTRSYGESSLSFYGLVGA